MKTLVIAALACLTLSNAELIKISGKWFNKVTITDEDGKQSKTLYTPIDHPQTPQPPTTSAPLKGKTPTSIQSPNQDQADAHRPKIKKAVRNARVNGILNEARKMAEQKYGAPPLHPQDIDDADDNDQKYDETTTQDTHQPQSAATVEQKIATKITTMNDALAKPPVAPVSKVSTDKLDGERPSIPEPEAPKTQTPSLRRNTQLFKDAESPFLQPKRISSDEHGNRVSDSTNLVQGKQNYVDGKYNDLIGNRNTIDNGNYNQIRGDRNVIQYGHSNVIRGDGSYVAGSGNIIY